MMETFIALFRGINVGGHNQLPMAELVILFNQLEFENVKTYIQSGNVVFESPERDQKFLIDQIRNAVQLKFGFRPMVLLLNAAALEDAIKLNPFPQASTEPKALHLYFLEKEADDLHIHKLETLKTENEQFQLLKKVFYLYAPDGIGRSKLAARVEKALGVAVTARNWRTVNKIVEMAKR